ncbi:hypothetical protein M2451_000017 [Dysgonomonas sp. PFB1-18]|nr:hypothetical protein [Dysgonomonas sp. PF1-14]MDH6337485.1 hypothetical protein [Dysgonomonas sp. PF1-16]MDH6378710.1 hypothetical protein [Dysgonomonas sp. PFB1-18]MDH6399128.1 hypothetical protein [Dysgonomonas sp. PF1-23]
MDNKYCLIFLGSRGEISFARYSCGRKIFRPYRIENDNKYYVLLNTK